MDDDFAVIEADPAALPQPSGGAESWEAALFQDLSSPIPEGIEAAL